MKVKSTKHFWQLMSYQSVNNKGLLLKPVVLLHMFRLPNMGKLYLLARR